MKSPILLIDADVLRYQLAFSNTTKIDWNDDGNTVEALQPERAKAKLEEYLDDLIEKFGARDIVLALSCKQGNFRKEIYPAYKENRKAKPKPALWYVLDDFIEDAFGDKIVDIPQLEGDDVLGLLATHPNPKRAPGNRIVVSIDKDMRTLPGIRLYSPLHPDLGVIEINHHDADLYWMKQALTGDATDNYPGFPGIGHKKADEILMPVHEQFRDASPERHLAALWRRVVETYTTQKPRGGDAPLTEKDALTQARLARIVRHGDYIPREQRVRLWTPPAAKNQLAPPLEPEPKKRTHGKAPVAQLRPDRRAGRPLPGNPLRSQTEHGSLPAGPGRATTGELAQSLSQAGTDGTGGGSLTCAVRPKRLSTKKKSAPPSC